ncbi:asparagine synthase-related protein [Rheinheimera sp. NSM]|uniref:asparagine synthase-related protein n=1 Tax=Rheinheimera sp. NSM TaxID=3457884 RepID=UPI004035E524
MVDEYVLGQVGFVLESDLAGEFPIYLYWPQDQLTLLYSKSITTLLNDIRLPKPLNISHEGFSFLLQSGVVPPPKTAYQDIYIVGIGDRALVSTENGRVQVTFSHEFPFMNANRLLATEMEPDEDLVLKMLAEATISRLDETKPSFLFHSAGKDSNAIALALAEAGWQDKITLITHKSKGALDESEISRQIAKKLGFKHRILHEVDQLQKAHHQAIENYFINAPFPCTDNVTLAYPLYAFQEPELRSSNLIFGDGNDSHMMSPPDKMQKMVLPYARFTSKFGFVRNYINSENRVNTLLRTPAEWFGTSGLSLRDCEQIYPNTCSVLPYWSKESDLRKDWDIFDFKTDIYSTRVITERMIRKLHNFSDVIGAKIILPFTDSQVAYYFGKMPESHLFDRHQLKNKLTLRKILKDRVELDSDAIGKMGWTYDFSSIVLQNWDHIISEIKSCKLWQKPGLEKVITRLKGTMQSKHKYAHLSGQLIYRIYLLSAWANWNRYLNG